MAKIEKKAKTKAKAACRPKEKEVTLETDLSSYWPIARIPPEEAKDQ